MSCSCSAGRYACWPLPWHEGQTSQPFAAYLVLSDSDATPRVDIESCVFRLINANTDEVLIGTSDDWAECRIGGEDGTEDGLVEYFPSALEMTVGATPENRVDVTGQFKATLLDGTVLPTIFVSGTILGNL